MRILQVQTQAEAAGAQRVSDVVGRGLAAKGHEVRTAFLYRKTDAYDNDPLAVMMLAAAPRSGMDYLRSLLGLVRFSRMYRPEAIISYQHYGNIAGAIAAKSVGCRKLIANQNGLPNADGIPPRAMSIDRILGQLGVYSANVVNSAFTEDAFADYPESYRQRLIRIDHGVAPLTSALTVAEARGSLGLPTGSIVGTAGRLVEQKNHSTLIRALAVLPTLQLAIAGAGPLRDALSREAQRMGVGGRVHFLGEIPPEDMGNFYKALDVFAFPSKWETFGLAVVEASISGLPIVCSDLSILREVLTPSPNLAAALFANGGDPQMFADQINQILMNRALATQLTNSGARLQDRYAVSKMVEAYEACLRD